MRTSSYSSAHTHPATFTLRRWIQPFCLGLAIALILPSHISHAQNTQPVQPENQPESQPENQPESQPEQMPPLRKLDCPATPHTAEHIGLDTALFRTSLAAGDRQALLTAIDNSLAYLQTPESVTAYSNYAVPSITHDRVRRSLQRFRTLVIQSQSAEELQQAVTAEFDIYQAIGQDQQGAVAFTGYFEPTYRASRTPDETYRYPIYQSPPNLGQWSEPHPTRLALEGADGLQASKGPIAGLELAWLPSRLEAFLIQVQGSARLELIEGGTLSVGYDGRTNYPYTSMGRALIDDGIIPEDELTLPVLMAYFEQNPTALDRYLPRNDRFVFFRETHGAPATGSLGVPVTAGRSIATDKSLMPPGALALITLPLPQRDENGVFVKAPLEAQIASQMETQPEDPMGDVAYPATSRFVLDQDTGGAIKGAGRVDLFIGTGNDAGQIAGLINDQGALYYLLIKE
ncbi:MAG: membrane-bound lytic murein transglycosylase MltA [Phormidesmis priestleyi Ana]|uniref:peptidoglycan lytic exotransglycosylase n=1 Tax=Phormidesmis priestleyi Ana TaxID=1666911 RepID=A0A0N8KMY1_9CYAN|nr:MAG: membrane-bound lytic murein transglycosylase MltA [Phormidesmis priestleyi Ana]